MKRFWLTLLFFVIASAILIFGFRQKSLHTSYPAAEGLIDLSEENIESGNFILEGQWEFYWEQLLTPEDLPAFNPAFVHVPSLWNNLELNGKPLSPHGYATYKLKVILPHHQSEMGLTIYDVYSSYKFYVNKNDTDRKMTIFVIEHDEG